MADVTQPTFPQPWAGLGIEVKPDLDTPDLLKVAGLNWTVQKYPLYFADNIRVPGSYVLARDTDKHIYSIVGENYVPTQPANALGFVKKLVEVGQGELVAVGALKGGQYGWALANLGQRFALPGDDQVEAALLFLVPYVLGTAMSCQLVMVRRATNCSFPISIHPKNKTYRFVQAYADEANIKREAEIVFGRAQARVTEFQQLAERFAQTQLKAEERSALVHAAFDMTLVDASTSSKEHRLVRSVEFALETAPGAYLPSTQGTYWGTLAAIGYVIDHQSGNAPDTRLLNAWFGWTSDVKRRAIAVLARHLDKQSALGASPAAEAFAVPAPESAVVVEEVTGQLEQPAQRRRRRT